MGLYTYFKNTEGTGILATADSDGMVDLAVYTKPEVIDDTTVAFIMKERLSHQNLMSNPHAAYMFIEKGDHYTGKRLYLSKIKEETNTSLIKEFIERQPEIAETDDDSGKFIVFFHVDNIFPLVGDKT